MDPLVGYNFAPRNWVPCDGRTLQISQFTALFVLIGTNFGGDGRTTFAVPNLPGPAASIGYFIALQGVFPDRG